MWTIYNVFIEFVIILLLFFFIFWFFGCESCEILAPQPGIEPAFPALEGEVLTTGLPGKSLTTILTHFPVFRQTCGFQPRQWEGNIDTLTQTQLKNPWRVQTDRAEPRLFAVWLLFLKPSVERQLPSNPIRHCGYWTDLQTQSNELSVHGPRNTKPMFFLK